MEQELRFGLDLGQLAVLKKKGLGRLLATFEGFFHVGFGPIGSTEKKGVWADY